MKLCIENNGGTSDIGERFAKSLRSFAKCAGCASFCLSLRDFAKLGLSEIPPLQILRIC